MINASADRSDRLQYTRLAGIIRSNQQVNRCEGNGSVANRFEVFDLNLSDHAKSS
jgi:hypothetical protein